jgi:hypothetical protein
MVKGWWDLSDFEDLLELPILVSLEILALVGYVHPERALSAE